MKLQFTGCSHHTTPVEIREQIAFSPDQIRVALAKMRSEFPGSEAVLLSTCNRVELYMAAEDEAAVPSHNQVVDFIAEFHGLDPVRILDDLIERTGEDVVQHLFTVAASLDSMVVGEAQILSQVKQAYELADGDDTTGPLIHSVFQRARFVAKRVANETTINQKRVSIPSVAVADYASQVFERFDDKKVLVIGAGEMGEETLVYLKDAGATDITIVNRSAERAERLAAKMGSKTETWDRLDDLLVESDMVISTTGAAEPMVTLERYQDVLKRRFQRDQLILDLAVPRDFDPRIVDCIGAYLVAIDDLSKICDANRKLREKEWPKANRIIGEETKRYMTDLRHQATGPTIRRLTEHADEIKQQELERLRNKLQTVDPKEVAEIEQAFDRLVNKLLHPPLRSLRDEAESGSHSGLLDALTRLFKLKE